MRGVSKKTLATIRKTKSELKQNLKDHPDVIGIGIGYKERKGKINNRCCIRIHVQKKFLSHLLPKKRRLPEEIQGIPIDVTEGVYSLHPSSDPTVYHSPLQGGIQIANINNYPLTGTLGGIVRDRETGESLIISNWHVLYGNVDTPDNETVVQPRRFGNKNIIGHTKIGIINDNVDCALARLNSKRLINNSLLNIPYNITGFRTATLGLPVIKSGVNGIARGIIDEIDFDIKLNMPHRMTGKQQFLNQIHIIPNPEDDKPFNVDEGDSGSLWISEEDHKAVGLHIGGIPYQKAIANHFDEVILALDEKNVYITFDS